jgi:hypothetical protein
VLTARVVYLIASGIVNFLQDVIVARARRDESWKSEDAYFEILGHLSGAEAY